MHRYYFLDEYIKVVGYFFIHLSKMVDIYFFFNSLFLLAGFFIKQLTDLFISQQTKL